MAVHTIKKKPRSFSEEGGLEVNAQKTGCMLCVVKTMQDKCQLINPFKSSKVQIFANDTKISKLHGRRNGGQIKISECQLPFIPESFVFPFAI
jgi:hypothetical protein